MEQYQDIWKKNGTVIKGVRECADRYKVIKQYLKKYKRPFTVLDIGANLGYFSFRIAHDFPNATCVMIENDYGKQLTQLADENNMNVIVLKKRVKTVELEKLATCEHFDVVLGLNVIHHIGDVSNSFPAIEKLGDNIIIETPNPSDEGACGKHRLQDIFERVKNNYKFLGSFTRHTSSNDSIMGVLEQKKISLERRYWDSSQDIDKLNFFKIDSDFSTKKFISESKKKTEIRNWIPGINYRTFQFLNGTYPSKKILSNSFEQLDLSKHTDVAPWNFIVNGTNFFAIDADDPRNKHIKNSSTNIKKIREEIRSGKINPVSHYM